MKRVGLIFGALVATVWWFVLRGGSRREVPEGVAPVTAEGAIDRARKMAAVDRVGHADLVGTWAPTTATDVEVLVEGNTFYPTDARGHRLGEWLDPRHAVRLPAGRRG